MGYRLYPRVEAANDGHEPVTKFHTITLSLASGTDVGRAERICFGWPDGLGKRLRVCYRSRLGEEEGSRLQAPEWQSCYRPSLGDSGRKKSLRDTLQTPRDDQSPLTPTTLFCANQYPKPRGGSGEWRLGEPRARGSDSLTQSFPPDLPNAGGW